METYFWIAVFLLQALIFGVIFRKAGYNGWLGLLMAVPVVNLGTLLWFATTTWPVEMGYQAATKNTNADVAWELKMALRKATTLEKQGLRNEAISQLEEYAEKLGEGNAHGALIRERIQQLKSKSGD